MGTSIPYDPAGVSCDNLLLPRYKFRKTTIQPIMGLQDMRENLTWQVNWYQGCIIHRSLLQRHLFPGYEWSTGKTNSLPGNNGAEP